MGPLPVCLRIMLLLLLPSLLLLLLRPGPGSGEASRTLRVHRRGILELAGTVGCVGPRTPIAYMKYGCFCGLGGHGQPLHAWDQATKSLTLWGSQVSPLLPGPAENKCQELLCKCDQEIANCLAQTEYNLKYLFYPQFLCEPDSPKCD
uniref:Phospholipase A2-like central domain-containing protein n=1 Tax=Pan paniscus TaxID=9597 RepID=A0A2R9BVF1_PANPA